MRRLESVPQFVGYAQSLQRGGVLQRFRNLSASPDPHYTAIPRLIQESRQVLFRHRPASASHPLRQPHGSNQLCSLTYLHERM